MEFSYDVIDTNFFQEFPGGRIKIIWLSMYFLSISRSVIELADCEMNFKKPVGAMMKMYMKRLSCITLLING